MFEFILNYIAAGCVGVAMSCLWTIAFNTRANVVGHVMIGMIVGLAGAILGLPF